MKLYSIRAKDTGKYFVHTNGIGTPVWNSTPVFFKTPDGIVRNLKRLCSEFYDRQNEIFKWCWEKAWRNFDATKLKHYEVVVWEVDVLNITSVPANDFVSTEDIEKAKV